MMKKTLGKPENWQDFENLCKKLWGEIWGISNKIKKNGRLGQEQAGVDIYGIPKGETNYWGIQCKGKNDYINSRLTIKEVNEEVEKAKKFQPKLEVYIIATTSNKDVKIEEFVRLKDIENRKNNSFEILLFDWEDIADLIEENSDTYNWFLNGISQKGKFDFRVSFNNLSENLILKPVFEKEILRYKLTNKTDLEIMLNGLKNSFPPTISIKPNTLFPFSSNKINKSWCDFELVMENTGSKVLEDWKFEIKFTTGIRRIDDGNTLFLPRISSTTYINDENKTIRYYPLNKSPLIQKDNRYFEVSLLTEHNTFKILAEWELLARDFNKTGTLEISIEPEYVEKIKFEEVNKETELIEDEIFILDYVIDRTNTYSSK